MEDASDGFPYVSVVIPVRNEARTIAETLRTVASQDVPEGRLEIVVLDGGSQDGTRAIVEQVAADLDVPVRLLENPRGSVPAALNVALEHVRGDYLVRVDGHSRPSPGYVRRSVEANVAHDADLAGGWVRAAGSTSFERAVGAALGSPAGMGNATSWRSPGTVREVASVPCGSYRVGALRAIGGFDEAQLANQDYEANYRVRRAGGRAVLLPDVWFDYVPRGSLRTLARQFWRYGFYKARTMVKHPASIRPRHLVPAAAVLVACVLALLAPWLDGARVVLAACLGLYVLLVLAAGAVEARRVGAAAAWLPLVFPTMHLAWGAGNVAGLARFLAARPSREP